MHHVTRFALIAIALVVGGCAQDTIAMRLSSEPPGARVSYRVVDASAPDRARTQWFDLGPSPVHRIVVMHPEWSLPQNLLEIKLEHPGYTPTTRTFTPSAILSSERNLVAHALLDVAPPPQPAAGTPAPAGK